MSFKKNNETKETKKNNAVVLEGETVKITIRPWSYGNSTIEFASIVIADEITINDCRISTTEEGKRFLALPQKKDKDGNYRYTVYIGKGSISDEINELLNSGSELPY